MAIVKYDDCTSFSYEYIKEHHHLVLLPVTLSLASRKAYELLVVFNTTTGNVSEVLTHPFMTKKEIQSVSKLRWIVGDKRITQKKIPLMYQFWDVDNYIVAAYLPENRISDVLGIQIRDRLEQVTSIPWQEL